MALRKIFPLLSFLLLASLAACMSPPTGLNLSLERHSVQNRYLVKVYPLVNPVGINKMHSWEIKLMSPSGEPVSSANITVDGGMPQHGHGFPTQPRVTRKLGDGRYLLEGVKFSMSGWWEIKLKIDAASGTDSITFNTVVPARAS